jgi:hypothetical protein
MNQLTIINAGQMRYCNIPDIYMLFVFFKFFNHFKWAEGYRLKA